MSWDRLKEKSTEEIVKGVTEKDDKPDKKESGSSAKCPSCGATLTIKATKEKEDEA